MKPILFPADFSLEPLTRNHVRKQFKSGQADVDRWLSNFALQHQEKHLSTTKVLVHSSSLAIAGFYTLATGQIDMSDLPPDITKRLPRRQLPVAVLAWLGVHQDHQRQGLGERLVAQALADCLLAGNTFSFVAVIVDCIDDRAAKFYQRWDFQFLPGHARRMCLSYAHLKAMLETP